MNNFSLFYLYNYLMFIKKGFYKINKKEYTTPILKFSLSEFEDILLISMVDGEDDIFNFDAEL